MSSAGYSGTPLPRKLGIGEGTSVALVGEPDSLRGTLGPLPPGAALDGDPWTAEVTLLFTTSRSELAACIPALAEAVFPDRTLWISWPKRASGVETDVTEDVVREVALPLGLVDTKVCAVDATWSALRLVWRRELRSGRPISPTRG
jgi:hypothetical protein